jgi:hypothetical protein
MFANPTFFSGKVQASTCNSKGGQEKREVYKQGGKGINKTLTSKHLTGRLDNTKKERITFFMVQNFSCQT